MFQGYGWLRGVEKGDGNASQQHNNNRREVNVGIFGYSVKRHTNDISASEKTFHNGCNVSQRHLSLDLFKCWHLSLDFRRRLRLSHTRGSPQRRRGSSSVSRPPAR